MEELKFSYDVEQFDNGIAVVYDNGCEREKTVVPDDEEVSFWGKNFRDDLKRCFSALKGIEKVRINVTMEGLE